MIYIQNCIDRSPILKCYVLVAILSEFFLINRVMVRT